MPTMKFFLSFTVCSLTDADSASLLQLSTAQAQRPNKWNLPGYKELFNRGKNGPCRLTSPTDNDISAWLGNKVKGGTMNCDVCADLCDRDVDLFGKPRPCIAMECSPGANGVAGVNGAICELWSAKPRFAGATVVNDTAGEDVSSAGTASSSGLHCYVKKRKHKQQREQESSLRVLASVYHEVKTAGKGGPCRASSPTDNDVTAHENNKVRDAAMTCNKCAAKCAANRDISGESDRECLGFECTESDTDPTPLCELWSKQPYFTATQAFYNDNAGDVVAGNGYGCFSKKPATLGVLHDVYTEIFNSQKTSGPCRGTSAEDNDLSAFADNKIVAQEVTCDFCSALCAQNIDLEGNDRVCKAFECTEGDSDSFPHCELWGKPAQYAADAAFNNGNPDDLTEASKYHCFTK